MADLKKFLDRAGVSTLWGAVIDNIDTKVKAEETRAKAEEAKNAAAAAAADQKAANAQTYAEGVNTRMGALPADAGVDTVVAYIDKKTAGIASDAALQELKTTVEGHGTQIGTLEGKVATIEGDYLKAADKTALEGSIDGVSGRVTAIENDYLKAADKTELNNAIALKADQTALDTEVSEREVAIQGLQNQIDLIMDNPDTKDVIDSIAEFTQYIADHGEIAEGFRTDIDKNAEDIAALDTAYKAADTAIKGRLDVLEAIDHDAYKAADTALENKLNTEIAKKAATDDVNAGFAAVRSEFAEADNAVKALITAEENARTAADTALGGRIDALDTAYKAADTTINGRLAALEAKFGDGEGTVDSKIEAAEQAAKDYADGLAGNYATKAQGQLADAAVRSVTFAENAAGVMQATVNTGGNSQTYDLFAALTTDEINAIINPQA